MGVMNIGAEEGVLSDHCMSYFMLCPGPTDCHAWSISFILQTIFGYVLVPGPLLGGTIQLLMVHKITT